MYLQKLGSGWRLRLSKFTSWAKSRLKPSSGPSLARLFLAWPGLASGLRPEPAHHYLQLPSLSLSPSALLCTLQHNPYITSRPWNKYIPFSLVSNATPMVPFLSFVITIRYSCLRSYPFYYLIAYYSLYSVISVALQYINRTP